MAETVEGGGPTGQWRSEYTLLSACVGSYFAVRFAQVSVGAVVPLIIGTFDISRGVLGAVLTGMWVAYALLQLPSGAIADRIGERLVILTALVVTAGATLGLAVAPAFLLFGAGVVALGAGAGVYYNPATVLLSRSFDEIGRAIGIHRVGGQAAGVVAPVAAAAVAARYGWRPAIALGSLLAVAAAGSFVLTTTRMPPVSPDASLHKAFDTGVLLGLLDRSHTRITTSLMTIIEFVGLATMAFLPALLVEYYGLSLGQANLLFAVFFAVSALCQPLSGWLSDQIGRDATATILATVGAVGYGALAVGGISPTGATIILALPAVVLAGATMSTTPVLQSRMLDGLDASNRGAGFGLFRTLYLLVGATGTTVVGALADVAGWGPAFGLLAGLLAIMVLILVAIGAGDTDG